MLSKNALKSFFPGVSWKHPVVNSIFHMINPIDWLVRLTTGRTQLPSYSVRVRSNGANHQFGGKNFEANGILLCDLLQRYADVKSDSKVLEIGCGCGRTAFSLSKILNDEQYYGMDIEAVVLDSCRNNPLFIKKGFHFERLDVRNELYNPNGKHSADSYVFPYPDGTFDTIFLVSVFTHMLTDDVQNYIKEISRMLRPGGICMTTTFLIDHGREFPGLSFPYNKSQHFIFNKDKPEIAVGYMLEFFERTFESHGAHFEKPPLLGTWRGSTGPASTSNFPQDVIFYRKAS